MILVSWEFLPGMNFVKCFFYIYWVNIFFFHSIVNYVGQFSDINSHLDSWDKPHLVMMDFVVVAIFMLLDSIC